MTIRCPNCEGTAQEEFIGDDVRCRCDECGEVFERYEQANMPEQNNPHDMHWRKFPEEKPPTDDYYECVAKSSDGTKTVVCLIYFGNLDRFLTPDAYGADVTHWRGGPLP